MRLYRVKCVACRKNRARGRGPLRGGQIATPSRIQYRNLHGLRTQNEDKMMKETHNRTADAREDAGGHNVTFSAIQPFVNTGTRILIRYSTSDCTENRQIYLHTTCHC